MCLIILRKKSKLTKPMEGKMKNRSLKNTIYQNVKEFLYDMGFVALVAILFISLFCLMMKTIILP